jgi:tripeptide aminopeptidase
MCWRWCANWSPTGSSSSVPSRLAYAEGGVSDVGDTRPVRERLVTSFTQLAQVDSPSRGEAALARLLIAELEGLGWAVVDDGSGPDCGNVIASLPGDAALDPLMFTSHMDVVMPCLGVRPRLVDGVFCSSGDTVLGADAKASVAALLELAQLLATTTRRRPPLELVFTWGEEVGHLGAKALDISRLRARRAYVLDGLTPVGTIIIAAPTHYSFLVRVIGRAAHAGVEPERGISAIAVAAQALSRLPWGRLDESTTTNVGTIKGGSVRNAVPAEAQLEGEVRSLVPERAATVTRAIQETFEAVAAEAGARVEIEMRRGYAGYELEPDAPLVELARGAFADLSRGGQSDLQRTGGGSDANELNERGITACVLGIGAEGCHSVEEQVSVDQLELLSEWVLAITRRAT